MNEAKFTKGDWKKYKMTMSPDDWAQLNSGKYPITIVRRGADVIAAVWGIEDEDEQANANLFAAAPVMYKALDELLKRVDYHCTTLGQEHFTAERGNALVALAKARGET